MLSPVRLSVCLSVTLVHPTQAVVIFGNFSTAFGTLAIRWHAQKNLWRSSQAREPLRRVAKPKRGGVAKIAILDISTAISRKRCKIRGKLVLITNRKSHMGFRLVPKSVTLNDPKRRNGPYFVLLGISPIFVYNVDVKQLLGLPRFQNLLIIVYDHIKTICVRNYSAIIWAKKLITRFDGHRCIDDWLLIICID